MSFISSDYPGERFDVYRKTVFENMINALKITYPGVWKLLGDECANSVAYAYCQKNDNLPKTGCLDNFGESFSEFLSTLPQLSELPYLVDYASYEWFKHLSYIARDSKPIAPTALSHIPEELIDNVTFNFCPSVFIFGSKYPLFDIHHILQNGKEKEIKLNSQASYGIIGRKVDDIHTYWIAEDTWNFIKSLAGGGTLLKSSEYAQKFNASFDLISTITFILKTQLINNIAIKRETYVK